MKYLFSLFVLLTFYLTTLAQDLKDPWPVLDINDTLLLRQPNKFVKGFACSNINDSLIDKALLMNFTHKTISAEGYFPLKDWESPVGQIRIQGYNAMGNGDVDYSMLQAPAIQFDPAITYYSNPNFNPKNFVPLSNDTLGRVFGFKNINLNVGSINGFEYQLDKSNVSNTITVLSEPWPDNEMIGMFEGSRDDNMDTAKGSNGIEWNLSINLKPLEQITQNNENEAVLILKVPYYLFNNQTKYYIKFAQEPREGLTPQDTTHIWSIRGNSDYRGIARKLEDITTQKDNIIITGKMLKTNSGGDPNTNITISAFFKLNNSKSDNPYLQIDEYKNGKVADRISHLGLEVIYNGKINVAINWLRFETPHAQDILRGYLDTAFAETYRYILNYVRGKRDDLRIFKFFGVDEFWPQHYLVHRYFNYLADKMGISELDHNEFPAQYDHCVGFMDYWNGTSMYLIHEVAAPYFRRTNRSISTINPLIDILPEVFNLSNGYYGFWTADSAKYLKDTINSHYESYLIQQYGEGGVWHFDHVKLPIPENINIWENCDYFEPNTNFYNCTSPLSVFEKFLYKNFYTKNSFLFSDDPWWAYIWEASGWLDKSSKFYINSNRPITGEESRYMSYLPVILGTKGLLYWWGISSYNFDDGGYIGMTSFEGTDNDHNSLPVGMDLIKSEILGGDFIQFPDDPSRITDRFNPDDILWDSLSIPQSRFYIGRKSQRLETYKLHSWINDVEETLLKLNLQTWFGKGYKIFNCVRPGLNTNIFDKYVKTKSIQTRPYNRTENGSAYYEPFDSAFFDITLLKSKDKDLNEEFYIGIVNRRSNPLFLYPDPPQQGVNSYMKFLTTAEFDTLCNIGGKDPLFPNGTTYDANYWKNYWWKRLGCREIKIPFNYPIDIEEDPNGEDWFNAYGYRLTVKEIGTFNHTWDQAPYYDRVSERTIDGLGNLFINFLPGEGKILKVKPIQRYFIKRFGKLDHPNQSKLIKHKWIPEGQKAEKNGNPVVTAEGEDSIRLHMVYFKPLYGVCDTNRYGVYYNRSKPFSKSSPDSSIIWEDSILVSRQIVDCQSQWEYDTMSCDYPSIVVREDANNVLKAYIVYTCKDLASPTILGDVVLSTLEVNHESSLQVEGSLQSHAIGEYYGRDRDSARFPAEWGTPVINASSQGNFIAWSDSLYGIQTAFNPINSNCIINGPTIKWHDDSAYAQHPSFNVYSSIDKSENNCSLVWQEKKSGAEHSINPEEKNFQIYFTRLNTNSLNDSVFNTLPTLFTNSRFSAETNQNSTIAKLSDTDQGRNNIIPVIIRDLKNYNTNPNDSIINLGINNRIDKVVWESQPEDRVGTVYLTSRSIGLTDSSNQYKNWRIYPIQKIKSNGTNIGSPNLALSQSLLTNDNNEYPGADMLLNFTYDGSIAVTISQLPTGFNSQMTDSEIYFNPHVNLTKQIKAGTHPHLALSTFQTDTSNLWMNRRVYEKGGCDKVKDILLNDQFFYNQTPYDIEPDGYVGFKGNQSIYCINVPSKDENIIPLNLPYQEITLPGYESHYEPKLRDTIYTEYFSVGEIDTINFRFFGFDTTYVKMYIQKQGSTSFTQVTLPPGEANDTNARYMLFRLIEGNESNFRLAFVNLDTNYTSYYEYLNIGLLPITDTVVVTVDLVGLQNSRTDIEDKQNIINEKIKLLVVPNPANDIVNITTIVPNMIQRQFKGSNEQLTLKLYSSLGLELFSQIVNSGQTISVPISQYSSGAYFIRAEYKVINNGISNPVQTKTEPLIIKK